MKKRWTKALAAVAVLSLSVVLGAACNTTPKAVSPEEFYRGKNVVIIASSGTAGGDATDLVARTVAVYLAKEIGANVKVENRDTDEGVNYVYTEGKRDGLMLVTKATNALVSNDILKAPGVLYDTNKFNFIADMHPAGAMMELSAKLPYKNLDDLRRAKGLKGGGTTAKGMLALGSSLAMEVLGLDGKVITGFNGKKALTLALGRGEVDFTVPTDTSAKQDEADGYIRNFLVLGDKRSIVLPDVPTLSEAGVKVPKELEAPLKYLSLGGYAAAVPPDVPADRVEYLRKVFSKLSENPELQAGIVKATGAGGPFMSGQELQDKVAAVKANNELAAQLDKIVAKHTAVQ